MRKHIDFKNDYQFFDTFKTEDHKIRGNYSLLIKVKFHEFEWSSPLMQRAVLNQLGSNPHNIKTVM